MMGRTINDLVAALLKVIRLEMFGLWMMDRMTNGLAVLRLKMTGLVMVASMDGLRCFCQKS